MLPTRCSYSDIALPIHLSHFSVRNHGSTNHLDWEGSTETTGDYFLVERSFDGVSFEKIAELPAQQQGHGYYAYVDEKPVTGKNYYRLLMSNADGAKEYSKVLHAFVARGSGFALSIYPNPAASLLNVTIRGTMGSDARLVLTDITGRSVADYKITHPSTEISFSGITSGIYYYQYTDGLRQKTLKVVEQ